ncbi:MAG: alkaline phosphatase PhoX [Pseudomonadota bacterium]
MERQDLQVVGYSDGDLDTNRSSNPTFESVVQARYSRRNLLRGGMAATTAAVFGGLTLTACSGGSDGGSSSTVSAGQAISSSAGKVITLSGSAGDSSEALSAGWTQIAGPAVTLQGSDTPTAAFLAPSVSAPTQFAFRYTVTFRNGRVVSADATVTVDPARLDFAAVPKNLNDIVTVPAGYTVSVLYRLGDPLLAGTSAYANNGSDTNFAARAGDHHDGMAFFGLAPSGAGRDDTNSGRGLLVMNHENITQRYLHANGATTTNGARPEAEAIKEIEAHGVSVVEVARGSSGWAYNQDSTLNRRITPNTAMAFRGPVAGSALIATAFSPNGSQGRGTINNCAAGGSPWGTYLTCEENWAGYFRRGAADNAARSAKDVTALARYGVGQGAAGNYGWATVTAAAAGDTRFARWNASATAADATGDFRNEPNQFGWVVEIDPYNPASTPRKRTALGRMGHENCATSLLKAGVKPAFYMGDDARNEYLYKFVSNTAWNAADFTQSDRLAVGDKYLDAGVLYVARFDADGTGRWLPLVFGQGPLTAANAAYPFADQADVLVNTRLAADAVGATKMDRPEWVAVNPKNGEVYLTLTNTNNTSRPLTATDAANPRFYNDPKGAAATAQRGNPNGHIIRLHEAGDTSEAVSFTWDIYLFGAGSDLDANINISGLSADNDFSSPDGLWFSRASNAGGQANPLLWIQTDDGAYTDVTNCMMLAALPGQVGDGGARTITNTDGTTTRQQATIAGKAATPANVRRFLVGPKECEITGIDTTPDGQTMFVNIQHPGEDTSTGFPNTFPSNWPASQTTPSAVSRPRSATIVITKTGGGIVGL